MFLFSHQDDDHVDPDPAGPGTGSGCAPDAFSWSIASRANTSSPGVSADLGGVSAGGGSGGGASGGVGPVTSAEKDSPTAVEALPAAEVATSSQLGGLGLSCSIFLSPLFFSTLIFVVARASVRLFSPSA